MNAELEAQHILEAGLVDAQARQRYAQHGQRHAQILKRGVGAVAAKPVAGLCRQSCGQSGIDARPAGQHAMVVSMVMTVTLIVSLALGWLADGKRCAAAGSAGRCGCGGNRFRRGWHMFMRMCMIVIM